MLRRSVTETDSKHLHRVGHRLVLLMKQNALGVLPPMTVPVDHGVEQRLSLALWPCCDVGHRESLVVKVQPLGQLALDGERHQVVVRRAPDVAPRSHNLPAVHRFAVVGAIGIEQSSNGVDLSWVGRRRLDYPALTMMG